MRTRTALGSYGRPSPRSIGPPYGRCVLLISSNPLWQYIGFRGVCRLNTPIKGYLAHLMFFSPTMTPETGLTANTAELMARGGLVQDPVLTHSGHRALDALFQAGSGQGGQVQGYLGYTKTCTPRSVGMESVRATGVLFSPQSQIRVFLFNKATLSVELSLSHTHSLSPPPPPGYEGSTLGPQ